MLSFANSVTYVPEYHGNVQCNEYVVHFHDDSGASLPRMSPSLPPSPAFHPDSQQTYLFSRYIPVQRMSTSTGPCIYYPERDAVVSTKYSATIRQRICGMFSIFALSRIIKTLKQKEHLVSSIRFISSVCLPSHHYLPLFPKICFRKQTLENKSRGHPVVSLCI